MTTATKTRKRLGKIMVGDAIATPKGDGIVKSIESARLYRSYPNNPSPVTERYHVTDSDHQWYVDRRDVRYIIRQGVCQMSDKGYLIGVEEAMETLYED